MDRLCKGPFSRSTSPSSNSADFRRLGRKSVNFSSHEQDRIFIFIFLSKAEFIINIIEFYAI